MNNISHNRIKREFRELAYIEYVVKKHKEAQKTYFIQNQLCEILRLLKIRINQPNNL